MSLEDNMKKRVIITTFLPITLGALVILPWMASRHQEAELTQEENQVLDNLLNPSSEPNNDTREMSSEEDAIFRYICIALLAGHNKKQWEHKKQTLVRYKKLINSKKYKQQFIDTLNGVIDDEIYSIDETLQDKSSLFGPYFFQSLNPEQTNKIPKSPLDIAEEYWQEIGINSSFLQERAINYMKDHYKNVPRNKRSPCTLWCQIIQEMDHSK